MAITSSNISSILFSPSGTLIMSFVIVLHTPFLLLFFSLCASGCVISIDLFLNSLFFYSDVSGLLLDLSNQCFLSGTIFFSFRVFILNCFIDFFY